MRPIDTGTERTLLNKIIPGVQRNRKLLMLCKTLFLLCISPLKTTKSPLRIGLQRTSDRNDHIQPNVVKTSFIMYFWDIFMSIKTISKRDSAKEGLKKVNKRDEAESAYSPSYTWQS